MQHGKVVGMVVARMGSTRIPGKALLNVSGKPVIWHILNATREIRGLDSFCLATSVLSEDDPLAEIAESCDVRCIRGDPERVLDRIYLAAQQLEADTIVSIGGDCPLIDPNVIDNAIVNFHMDPCDYLSNYEPPTFPEGMDVNIVSRRALDIAFRMAVAPSQRIHPFSYLTRHAEKFRMRNFEMIPNLSTFHWSLDFPEDIEFIVAVYQKLYKPGRAFRLDEILELIDKDEDIALLNHKLLKPKALHAFWNSPGIIRDMNDDIAVLSRRAREALDIHNYTLAVSCYSELGRIAGELQRMAEFNLPESADTD